MYTETRREIENRVTSNLFHLIRTSFLDSYLEEKEAMIVFETSNFWNGLFDFFDVDPEVQYGFYDYYGLYDHNQINNSPNPLKLTEHNFDQIDTNIHKNCSICFDDFSNDDKISITECNHSYHTNCIEKWIKNKRTCPICRRTI